MTWLIATLVILPILAVLVAAGPVSKGEDYNIEKDETHD